MTELHLYGLKLPLIKPGDDVAKIIVDEALRQGVNIENGDVVVITCKIVSKALGSMYRLEDVEPSKDALELSKRCSVDPRFIEVLLRESDEVIGAIPVDKLVEEKVIDLEKMSRNPAKAYGVVKLWPTIFITIRDGSLWTDSGIDSSNSPPGTVSVPPRNLDRVAKMIRNRIAELTGKRVAVVICDTEMFLGGSLDFARGSYGIVPIDRCFGEPDLYGKPKFGGVDIVVHELCAAAALLMKQTGEGVPVVIVRGLKYEVCECGLRDYLRFDSEKLGRALLHIVKHTREVLGLRRLLKFLKALIL